MESNKKTIYVFRTILLFIIVIAVGFFTGREMSLLKSSDKPSSSSNITAKSKDAKADNNTNTSTSGDVQATSGDVQASPSNSNQDSNNNGQDSQSSSADQSTASNTNNNSQDNANTTNNQAADTQGTSKNSSNIKIGSTKNEVLNSLGKPDSIKHNASSYEYNYKGSSLSLYMGQKVIGWTNNGNLNVNLGSKVSSAPPIKVGSTMDQVVKAMGTPDYYQMNINNGLPAKIGYKGSYIYFKNGKVSNWENSSRNLKLAK